MIWLLFSLLPLHDLPVNRCDVIEHNHFYDCTNGRVVFDQWIFWDFNDGEWELVDWRLHKGEQVRDGLLLVDGKLIKSPIVMETWTDFDRELIAREKTPKEKRKGLR